MVEKVLKVLLVDEGMNTGEPTASKIGGGQIARKRFFSNRALFEVKLLTSEPDIAAFWEGEAAVLYCPELRALRPLRTDVAKKNVCWKKLLVEGLRVSLLLGKLLEDDSFDVIYFNDNKSRLSYILGRIVGNVPKLKAKTAIEVDGEWNLGLSDYFFKLLYMVFFDRIICPTRAVKVILGHGRFFFPNKFLIAYPGVEKPQVNFRNKGEGEKKKVIFGCIGTLRTVIKGQDVIVEAVDKLIRENGHFPLEVRFYGDGPDCAYLQNIINKNELQSYFRFMGYVQDQEKIYGEIDTCIVASRTETASIVLMECLMRNIPVLVSNLEGVQEIKSQFYDELSFQSGNADELAVLLKHTLESDVLGKIRGELSVSDKTIITKDYQVERVYRFLSAV